LADGCARPKHVIEQYKYAWCAGSDTVDGDNLVDNHAALRQCSGAIRRKFSVGS